MATWTCPFCNQNATIIAENTSEHRHGFNNDNRYGDQIIRTKVIVCPNAECKKYTLNASLDVYTNVSGVIMIKEGVRSWQLVPSSEAKVFPEYIPEAILKDYYEACLIRDLSPKASATLSRRCLQGIIRDYWGVTGKRLIDEIEGIKDKVEPLTWQAIDAVRLIGNIGAHMEKDINMIIDVDPQEASLLIGLIEILLRDWYVLRQQRGEQLRAIVSLSEEKRQLKTQAHSGLDRT
jgi:hypothetical protein